MPASLAVVFGIITSLEYICMVWVQVSSFLASSKDIQAIDSSLERFWNRPIRRAVQGEEPELRCTAVGTRIHHKTQFRISIRLSLSLWATLSMPSDRKAGFDLSP